MSSSMSVPTTSTNPLSVSNIPTKTASTFVNAPMRFLDHLPLELRDMVYNFLFKIASHDQCQEIYMANRQTKTEMETQYLMYMTKQVKALNSHPLTIDDTLGNIRADIETPANYEEACNLMVHLRFELNDAPSIVDIEDLDALLELRLSEALKPILALRVESVTFTLHRNAALFTDRSDMEWTMNHGFRDVIDEMLQAPDAVVNVNSIVLEVTYVNEFQYNSSSEVIDGWYHDDDLEERCAVWQRGDRDEVWTWIISRSWAPLEQSVLRSSSSVNVAATLTRYPSSRNTRPPTTPILISNQGSERNLR